MQKKVIALAVAALASSAAFAQTNVTMYGVMDVQQAWVKSSGGYVGQGANPAADNQGTVGRLDSHGNYIGFKGVEDLGNGLKALFLYETAIGTDNGGGMTGSRDAYVGMTGGFGTVVAGNLTHPLRAMGAKVENLPGAAGFGTMASLTGAVAGMKTGADDRASNAIAYVSPSFGGFSGTVAYVNGENKTNEGVNQRAYQLAGQYENGPLFVGLGYHHAADTTATVTPTVVGGNVIGFNSVAGAKDGGKVSILRLAAAYTLPTKTKLTALVDRTKATDTTLVLTGLGFPNEDVDVKRTAFSLGVAQEIGKNIVGLEYARAGKLKVDGDKIDDSTANMWTLNYGYNLSKRTMLHARYSRLSNQDNVNYNFYNLPVGQGEAPSFSSTYSGFSVGMRHSF